MSNAQDTKQKGMAIYRADELKPFFSFKGFWENATHYATTREHAEKYLAKGCELTQEFLPENAKILDLTGKGDFMDNLPTLKQNVPELKAAWNKRLLRFDMRVIRELGYDAVKFTDALGETVVK